MSKVYGKLNVLEALMNRFKFIFSKFDNIILAFSGGKDSGLLLELMNMYYVEHNLKNRVSVYHIDYEGNYQYTIDYVERCMNKYSYFDYYNLCMPVSAACGVSMFQSTWTPWNPAEKDIWVRQPPKNSITLNNHEFDFFKIGMSDYLFQNKFSIWLHEKCKAERTAVLVGIRTQESLTRYHAVTRGSELNMFENVTYSTRVARNVYNFYPLYDWLVGDIWIANAKFGFDYNKLYDIYNLAGVSLPDMRVANPFHNCGVHMLSLYRAIEPDTWSKLIGRVSGANFAALYGGTRAMGYKKITLPKGHTWKSYARFLLSTLPSKTRDIYLTKFRSSYLYWTKRGGALPIGVVEELEQKGVKFKRLGKPQNKRVYKSEYEMVRFPVYPDDIDTKHFRLVPSYKRMCVTIMKNDSSCRYMGFGQTKDELQMVEEAMEKWQRMGM